MKNNLQNNFLILLASILIGLTGAYNLFYQHNELTGALCLGLYMGSFSVAAFNIYMIRNAVGESE